MSNTGTPRRHFLVGSVAALSALKLGIPLAEASAAQAAAAAAPDIQSYQPAYFSNAEWRFLLSACDRLIPADEEGPGAIESNVPVFIDQQMLTSYGKGEDWYMAGPHDPHASGLFGYQLPYSLQEVYRRGIAAVEAYCQKTHQQSFEALDAQTRDAVLTQLQKGEIDFASFGEDALTAKQFFSILLEHTKEGYLSDPIYGGNKGMAAWQMIGFPGARASYHEWVSQHNVKYPLGPVSLSGARA